jgi:hypothetical protein
MLCKNPKDFTNISVPTSCQMSTMDKTIRSGPQRADSRTGGKKNYFVPPSKCGQAKNIYNNSERLSVAQRLGVGPKCSICKSTNNDTTEEDKNICNSGRPRAPSGTPGPGDMYKHAIILNCMITHDLMCTRNSERPHYILTFYIHLVFADKRNTFSANLHY